MAIHRTNQIKDAAAAAPPPRRFSRRALSIDFFSFFSVIAASSPSTAAAEGEERRGEEEEDHQHLICAITRVEWNKKKGQFGARGLGSAQREKEAPHCPIGNAVIRFFLRPSSDFSLSDLIERRITSEYFIARWCASADGPALPLRRLQAGGLFYRLINVTIVKSL
jgi:hypothetical protein